VVSRSLANNINGALFGKQSTFPVIDTWYFGLCTQEPTVQESTGDAIINGEITNAGYSRVAITNSTANFNTPTHSDEIPLSYVSNKTTISMPVITGGSEVEVPYFFMSRNQTGNTCEVWGKFSSIRKLTVDSQLIIYAGGAVFEIANIDTQEA